MSIAFPFKFWRATEVSHPAARLWRPRWSLDRDPSNSAKPECRLRQFLHYNATLLVQNLNTPRTRSDKAIDSFFWAHCGEVPIPLFSAPQIIIKNDMSTDTSNTKRLARILRYKFRMMVTVYENEIERIR